LKAGWLAPEANLGLARWDCLWLSLLKLSRETINRSQKLDYALISSLERDPLLAERLERLRTGK
jgi:hypothetical protein